MSVIKNVTGTNIEINDSDGSQISSISIKGVTEQSSTPTPSNPQDISVATGEQIITVNGTDYILDLGDIELCKIGDYQDYIYKENGIWYLHKEVEKVVLDGSEEWIQSNTRFHINLDGYSSGTYLTMSDYFVTATSWANHTSTDYSIILYQDSSWSDARLSINDSDFSSGTPFKEWLSSNNVTVYYQLAEPTTTAITDMIVLEQLDDLNNINLPYGSVTITNEGNLAGVLDIDYYALSDDPLDNDKRAILNGVATILTEIEVFPTDSEEESIILTEDNSVISWNHEDFRYVKDEGWIGQFVARQVTGELKNISDDFNITDKEFELRFGVKVEENINWYSLGNFLVTKVTDDEVNDKTSFEALDYTKKFNKVYEDTITYPCTALELALNVCNQCDVELATTDFTNNDYIIEGNSFTNGETCRDVMKAIGKLAFSWVRIDWDNKVYIDFDIDNTIIGYNIIDNSKYYELTTQKEVFGPINRIIIGYSQIDGERTYIEDEESIEENGLCELTIYDNPLVYTQEQRESIINSASSLLGLTYTPLNTLTVGHPWFKGTELIQVIDMENESHDTIPFDRTIQYFGHIKTLINSQAPTRTETEYAYPTNIGMKLRSVEINVDKINGTITEEILGEDPDSLQSTLSRAIRDINSLTNIFQITGGSNLIRNSQFLLEDKTWIFTDNGTNPKHTELGESYNPALIGQTVSHAEIYLRNTILNSGTTDRDDGSNPLERINITGLVIGQTYTLSYYYKQDEDTTTILQLFDETNSIVKYITTNGETGETEEYDLDITYDTEKTTRQKQVFQFIATTSNYQLRITTSTTRSDDIGYFYFYDLMLNSGDEKPWEPAQSEIVSTILQMSMEGLRVNSVGANTTTLLNAAGLNIYDANNNTKITSFDNTGMETKTAKMEEANIDDYIMKTMTINSKKHHIEYFGGGN